MQICTLSICKLQKKKRPKFTCDIIWYVFPEMIWFMKRLLGRPFLVYFPKHK